MSIWLLLSILDVNWDVGSGVVNQPSDVDISMFERIKTARDSLRIIDEFVGDMDIVSMPDTDAHVADNLPQYCAGCRFA